MEKLTSVGSVIEMCKEHGLMLFAAEGNFPLAKFQASRVSTNETIFRTELEVIDKEQWRVLLEVYPNPDDSVQLDYEKSGIAVSESVYEEMNSRLGKAIAGQTFKPDEVLRISSMQVLRCFVYVDLSDFSTYSDLRQVYNINMLGTLIKHDQCWAGPRAFDLGKVCEAVTCIGDGYIFAFEDPLMATYFAARLACLMESWSAQVDRLDDEFHFRVGIHYDHVFWFWDHGSDRWNYCGKGINGGKRVLDAIGSDTDDVVYMSGQVKSDLVERRDTGEEINLSNADKVLLENILGSLINKGRKRDKHDNWWRVYQLEHTAVAGGHMKIPFN